MLNKEVKKYFIKFQFETIVLRRLQDRGIAIVELFEKTVPGARIIRDEIMKFQIKSCESIYIIFFNN